MVLLPYAIAVLSPLAYIVLRTKHIGRYRGETDPDVFRARIVRAIEDEQLFKAVQTSDEHRSTIIGRCTRDLCSAARRGRHQDFDAIVEKGTDDARACAKLELHEGPATFLTHILLFGTLFAALLLGVEHLGWPHRPLVAGLIVMLFTMLYVDVFLYRRWRKRVVLIPCNLHLIARAMRKRSAALRQR